MNCQRRGARAKNHRHFQCLVGALWDFENNDVQLLARWTGQTFRNAAEILRSTDSGWKQEDIEQFKRMLLTVYHPLLEGYLPEANGNWDAAMATAASRSMFSQAGSRALRNGFQFTGKLPLVLSHRPAPRILTRAMKLNSSFAILLLLGASLAARAGAVCQWSTPIGAGRAFLWIPSECKQVRAVVVGQDNMIEQGILEHTDFRKEMAKLGIAEIFIAPPFDTFQSATNNDHATAQFDAMLKSLADESGYGELKFAPVVPLGHSAMASYPWNFAAWNPSRTLAILSVHGDSPQTRLTGNGRPNLDWGDRNIDGIPGLMVMAEYEWWEDRLASMLPFRAKFPGTPVALLAEPGRGHFDYSDDLVKFLALFIRKAAEQRLPAEMPLDQPPVLKPVNPTNGWLVQRWHLNQPRTVKPAPFAKYTGDRNEAFWAFDEETALAIQNYRANQIAKLPQLLGFVQDGKIITQVEIQQQVSLKFEPEADGVTFHLTPAFLSFVDGGSKNTTRWTGLPAGSPIGHAAGGGPIVISRISGPVEKLNADTFRVQFDRIYSTTDRRNSDIWLLASQPGDTKYKSAVQQALLKLPAFRQGAEQHITFPEIPDQKAGTTRLKLNATSDSGRPVYFYVREGPAVIDGGVLHFTKIPPRAKFPVEVTVVAWQLGRSAEPKLKTATPVERTFELVK